MSASTPNQDHLLPDQPNQSESPLAPHQRVSVVIIDDQPLMAKAINDLLQAKAWIDVAGIARTAADAMPLFETERPDVAILDLQLGDATAPSTDLTRWIRNTSPSTSVVVYSAFASAFLVHELGQMGVLGYVTKAEPPSVLVEAVTAASRGHALYSCQVRALVRATRQDGSPSEAVTAREAQVVRLMAEGLTNRDIARRLSIATSTVINLAKSASSKLAAPNGNRTLLVLRAVRAGLVSLD